VANFTPRTGFNPPKMIPPKSHHFPGIRGKQRGRKTPYNLVLCGFPTEFRFCKGIQKSLTRRLLYQLS
jgi:hypothetical protein